MAMVVKMNHLRRKSGLDDGAKRRNAHVECTLDQKSHERDEINASVVL